MTELINFWGCSTVETMADVCVEAWAGCESENVVCLIICQAKHLNQNVTAYCFRPPGYPYVNQCRCEYPC